MMQVPLTTYPPFSQFLQLQQLHQQHFSQSYPTLSPELGSMLLSSRRSGAASCSEASTETPSTSPSPPPSIVDNFPSSGSSTGQQNTSKSIKSFTIDAILGIRDREIEKINRDHLNAAISNSYHPKLGLNLTGSHHHFENYSNSLNLSNAGLDIRTRIDVARYSTSARDLLGFQLPTDFSSSADVPGSEINKKNLPNQISTFSNSNPCGSLTEKPLGELGKKCGGKSKRVRTIFTPEQLERLEAEFERQQYMVGPERLYLAHTLQLTEAQVKVWFQNRRIKWRKQHLEIQQQRLAAIKEQNQRGELEESDNEESGDSNNFAYSGDNCSRGHFHKSHENNLEVGLGQFHRVKAASPSPFQNGENVPENSSEKDSKGENNDSK